MAVAGCNDPTCLEPTSPATKRRPAPRSSTSTSYDIELDLTTGPTTFATTTTIAFTCTQPGAETFVDLVERDRPRDHAQRRCARPGDGVRRQPDPARPTWQDDNDARRACRLHLLAAPARGCTASSTRSTTASTPTRSSRCRTPAACYHLRAARPQGRLHLPRDRARELGRGLQRAHPRAAARRATARLGVAVPARPSGCRRTSPRSSPASTTQVHDATRASTATSRSATTAASRWWSTWTPTSSSRSPSRASSSSRRPSTTPTRSTSTTSSTCRSTTWARWRTPAP